MGDPDACGGPDGDAVATLARLWLQGVTSGAFVPGPRARARLALQDLLSQIIIAVTAEPFDPGIGDRFGAQLVQWRMTAPEVLGTTLTLLGEHLPHVLGDSGRDLEARVRDLLAHLATGFTGAQRHAAVAAAEQINAAYRTHWHAELASLQEQLSHSLLHDPRTGLRNRAGLRKDLAALAVRQHSDRIGVCLLAIDRFTEINDALSHEHGDRLLRAVAARLHSLAAESRHVVAHPADDQFAFVLAGTTSVDEVVKIADQARQLLRIPIKVDDHDLHLTCTAGVLEGPAARTQPDGWLRDAHLALHNARQDHRDLAVFDPGRAASDLYRHRLAAAMPAALERGEFVTHFQPLHRLHDRRIVGVEALARWHRPDGLLSPRHFIGLAEQTGLIHPLGHHLLAQACAHGARWQTRRPGLIVSVNLSPRQLADPGLVADIDATLRASRLPAENLQLEITESAAVGAHHDVLHRLAGLGVRLAIDDFGTGYSTFASLPDLPITTVKLAAELLPRHPDDHTRRAVLHTLIWLCHHLDISVTSEGIETAAHEQLLHELGCDHGQGFHYTRPADADTITTLLS
ncbi:bifunctional diguanylate cyclase/phosphodiesterase [Actinoplanes sp. ATCC 53533]|uniref:putative bifunctional diguanylate cyclase/phosphodiesterase n=1 Tax=Actinoplanes sp. ATCC 53533 TaxID=1288362 RepID=UPI0013156C2D|nr:bifunctional diguanylate cyclase/phosphodiesterase [Actinoplanes sp. ATCC 53533]